jgi:pantothenate kinase
MAIVTWEVKASEEIERRVCLAEEQDKVEGTATRTAATGQKKKKLFIIALAGLPGAGKSTSAANLAKLLGEERTFILPLDGYHVKLNLLNEDEKYRRGAPDTFDAASLIVAIKAIRETAASNQTSHSTVKIPGFDHSIGDPLLNQHTFSSELHDIVIIEGLYCLLRSHGFNKLRSLVNYTIGIESNLEQCIATLKVRNKCIPGYTAEEIDVRCEVVDRKNAELVKGTISTADLVVQGYDPTMH